MNTFFDGFTGQAFFHFFLKAFMIVFSFLYLLYSIIITKQTKELNASLEVNKSQLIYYISSVQILFGIILVLFSIFVL